MELTAACSNAKVDIESILAEKSDESLFVDMLGPKPVILFIDAYDSFSNNIISHVQTTIPCFVEKWAIDDARCATNTAFIKALKGFDAVICGPGPGHPLVEKDVGPMRWLWELSDEDLLPVLGICLGFQSLAVALGAEVKRLGQGLHGMIRTLHHVGQDAKQNVPSCGADIFEDVENVEVTLYQSLCADIGQEQIPDSEWVVQRWQPGRASVDLQPLAWVEQYGNSDRRILMAIRHRSKPFWALQYHPESICTNAESKKVIRNWLMRARRWNKGKGRHCGGHAHHGQDFPQRAPLLARIAADSRELSVDGCGQLESEWHLNKCFGGTHYYKSEAHNLSGGISAADLVDALTDSAEDRILLESTNSHIHGHNLDDVRGRYSIVALDVNSSPRVEFCNGASTVTVTSMSNGHDRRAITSEESLAPYRDVWGLLAFLFDQFQFVGANNDMPFQGGFIGYMTYEFGVEHNTQTPIKASHSHSDGRPDLNFAWITKSLVVDHVAKKAYLQYLSPVQDEEGDSWLDRTTEKLQKYLRSNTVVSTVPSTDVLTGASLKLPTDLSYEEKVEKCQESIRSGDSYELCLTDQTVVTLPKNRQSGWALYRTLRRSQPAPFASFLRLGPATFVSASPERFLKWDRSGLCEMRPMKGTVKKSSAVKTLRQAEALLQIPKEQAENLMIVDLARHDLHGVCGSGNVSVPKLMVVQEHASVFQMISVVEGQIPRQLSTSSGCHLGPTGLDVLADSLPPGSMTGAPKTRACRILRQVERDQERSLYSGVVGYLDIGGNGDFSVNIRCMFRWDDEKAVKDDEDITQRNSIPEDEESIQEKEVWHIGAGGAVTALSTAIGEREEMQAKLAGTLGILGFPSA